MKFDVIQIGSHTGDTPNDNLVRKLLTADSNAIFVEPVKELFDQLVSNYRRRYPHNKFHFINKACGQEVGILDLYVPVCESPNKPWWVDQLTSYLPNHFLSVATKHNIPDIRTAKISVDCITISDIVREYHINEINYLLVDTEGYDFEVLCGLDFNLVKPKRIVFEHQHIEGTWHTHGDRYQHLLRRLEFIGYHKVLEDHDDVHLELLDSGHG